MAGRRLSGPVKVAATGLTIVLLACCPSGGGGVSVGGTIGGSGSSSSSTRRGPGSGGNSGSGTSTTNASTSSGSTGTGSTNGNCPANSGGTVYVDALAGSDDVGTGVSTPPSCAYQTLTHALRQAANAGASTVEAVGGTASLPAIFSSSKGEVLPIQIPDGIALTTDLEVAGKGGSAPAYTIKSDDPNATSAAVLLLTGASIAGFTVQSAAAGSLNADGIDCSAGAATVVDSVLLGPADAGGTGSGCNATDSCNLMLSNVSIEGYGGPGVSIAGTASAAIDGGTLSANGWGSTNCSGDGVFMSSTGTLSINNVTLAGNQSHGLQAVSGTVTASALTIQGTPMSGSNLGTQAFGLGLGTNAITGGPAGCSTAIPSTATATLTGLSVSHVSAQGVDVNGGQLSLLGAVALTNNGGHGLDVSSGTVYVEDPTVINNGNSGLRNDTAGTGSLTVDGGEIGPDGLAWTEVSFSAGADLTLIHTTVQVLPNLSGVITTAVPSGVDLTGTGTYSLTGCNIFGAIGAGLHLAGGGTLAAFSGNEIHGNGTDQVYVEAGSWDLSSPDGCGNGQNEIYCYAKGFVGLCVDGGSVTANELSWANATPTPGTDYTGSVSASGSCGPTSCNGGGAGGI